MAGNYLDDIMSHVVAPTLLVAGGLVEIGCIVTAFKTRYQVLINPSVTFFLLGTVNTICTSLLICTIASKVHTTSKRKLKQWTQLLKKSWRKRQRKSLTSLRPMKMSFNVNYYTALTPLAIQDFSFKQAVTLILIA